MTVIDERYVTRMEQELAALREDKKRLIRLITRVVTGDGQQLSNLDMTIEEWETECGNEDVDVTLDFLDWVEMVRVAREGRYRW